MGVFPRGSDDLPCKRGERHHQLVRATAESVIKTYRQRMGIEEAWSIEVQVLCPSYLPQSEASIWWDAEVWFARMHLRCGLSAEFLTWLILHELYELQAWRSGAFSLQLLESLRDTSRHRASLSSRETMKREWQRLRNQEIEWRIYGLTGCRRPDHLMEEPVETWDSFSLGDCGTSASQEQIEYTEKGEETR
jgi:hypothetical protein